MTAFLSVICLRYIYLRISKIDSLVRNSSSELYLTLEILLVDAVAIFKCFHDILLIISVLVEG